MHTRLCSQGRRGEHQFNSADVVPGWKSGPRCRMVLDVAQARDYPRDVASMFGEECAAGSFYRHPCQPAGFCGVPGGGAGAGRGADHLSRRSRRLRRRSGMDGRYDDATGGGGRGRGARQSRQCDRRDEREHERGGAGRDRMDARTVEHRAAALSRLLYIRSTFVEKPIWPRIKAAKQPPSSKKFSIIVELCRTNPSAHSPIFNLVVPTPCKATPPKPRRPIMIS